MGKLRSGHEDRIIRAHLGGPGNVSRSYVPQRPDVLTAEAPPDWRRHRGPNNCVVEELGAQEGGCNLRLLYIRKPRLREGRVDDAA
eukprot:11178758-Lingulodinium_polyedra.AAC.1